MACAGCARRRAAWERRIRSWINTPGEQPICTAPIFDLYRIGDMIDGYEVTRVVGSGREFIVYGRKR